MKVCVAMVPPDSGWVRVETNPPWLRSTAWIRTCQGRRSFQDGTKVPLDAISSHSSPSLPSIFLSRRVLPSLLDTYVLIPSFYSPCRTTGEESTRFGKTHPHEILLEVEELRVLENELRDARPCSTRGGSRRFPK